MYYNRNKDLVIKCKYCIWKEFSSISLRASSFAFVQVKGFKSNVKKQRNSVRSMIYYFNKYGLL